jgi:hypothetical protein
VKVGADGTADGAEGAEGGMGGEPRNQGKEGNHGIHGIHGKKTKVGTGRWVRWFGVSVLRWFGVSVGGNHGIHDEVCGHSCVLLLLFGVPCSVLAKFCGDFFPAWAASCNIKRRMPAVVRGVDICPGLN